MRLTGHALQILEVLLESPNQVVAREELQQRLWKGTTFVDFNHGLNAAMNKLRQTLGDSADQPRYVETVTGKGYRFIAPVSFEPVAAPVPTVSPVEPGPALAAPVAPPPPLSHAMLVGLSLAAVVLVVGVWWFTRHHGNPPDLKSVVTHPVRYQIAIPEGLVLSTSETFSLSPDGKHLVYFAKNAGGPSNLWVQALDSLQPRVVPIQQAGGPLVFWSPDSKSIGFGGEGKLRRVDLAGNPAAEIRLAPAPVGAAWGRDGTILFGTETSAILRMNAGSETLIPVTVRDAASERVHIFPVFLPDGKHFLYSRQSSSVNKTGIYIGSIGMKPGQQSLTPLIVTPFAAQFVESSDGNGVIVYQRETTLWARKFDLEQLRLVGEPQMVAERVGNSRAFGFFAASSGVLIYRSSTPSVTQWTWLDRSGRRIGTLGPPVDPFDNPPRISPDGSKIALTRFGAENTDIWIHDLSRDATERLTLEPAPDQAPVWSPDGRKVVFSSARGGHFDLYQMNVNGEGGQQLLYASGEDKYASSWSSDGRFLLFDTEKRDGIWMLPLEGGRPRAPVPFLQDVFAGKDGQRTGVFSPDSQWVAYVSSESGRPEVYVRRFPVPLPGTSGGTKVLISRSGGMSPRWRADGKELFYRALNGELMSAAVTTDGVLQSATPKALFACDALWEVTGDGNRFLVSVPVEKGLPPFTVVLNWQAALRK